MMEENQYNEDKSFSSEENKSEKTREEKNKSLNQKRSQAEKIKNLISIIILLTGLFIGSLFVDVSQLIQGGGVSQKILNNKDVFELNGKTWVAYTDPIIKLKVINDDKCENCKPDQILLSLRKVIPTILLEKVNYDSDKGKELIKKFNIKTLPAFVFDSKVKDTDFYLQAKPVMDEKDNWIFLNGSKAGIPAGKYINSPKVEDKNIVAGKKDAQITLVEFSDFQCPYCKVLHPVIEKILQDDKYKDKVNLAFKYFPLENIHPMAMKAALAASCAQEQGKFMPFADKLFENQKEWTQKNGEYKFKVYARQVGLDVNKFNQCYKDKKHEKEIKADMEEAKNIGISGTPTLFIGDTYQGGGVDEESIKKTLDKKLENK